MCIGSPGLYSRLCAGMTTTAPDLTDPHAPPAWHVLLPAGLAEGAFLVALGWWPEARTGPTALLLFVGAFAAYLLAALRIKDARGGGATIWILGAGMRLALLPLLPALSHEVYRYLWDGHLQLAGINPFRYVPADGALLDLRVPSYALLQHPSALTPYPPLDQMAFLGIAMAGGAVFQAKLLWLGFDLGTGWLLSRVAYLTGRSRRLTQLLYLWSPLLVVEVAWNAQAVSLTLFALVLVVLLVRTPASAGVAHAAASLTALPVIVALPALWGRMGRRFAAGFGVTLVALGALYASAGPNLLRGLSRAFTEVRFMEGPFLLIEWVVPGALAPRLVALGVVLAVAVWIASRGARPETALFWVLGAAILMSPALRPAAVLWILPFAALRASRTWILFTGFAFLAYAGTGTWVAEGNWPQPLWARLLVWVPMVLLLVDDVVRSQRARIGVGTPAAQAS